MSLRDDPQFDQKMEQFNYLLGQRGERRSDIDQHYLTIDSIINRIEALKSSNQLDGKRFLTIGDADLTGLAIAIFGNPSEVVVADIDDRLSEIYFEATMEYDLPVRFVYHDMRIKIIAILMDQYSPVLLEPPRTKEAVEVFLSRAVQIVENDESARLFCTIPTAGKIRDHFDDLLERMSLDIVKNHGTIVHYLDGIDPADYIELTTTSQTVPLTETHHIRPFYEYETIQSIHEYRCVCRRTIPVGPQQEFDTIEDLESSGCSECGYQGVFAFSSKIQLK